MEGKRPEDMPQTKYPYVDLLVKVKSYSQKPGEAPTEKERLWRWNLDNTGATLDHLLRYTEKGYKILGYGNLQVTARDERIADEHRRIMVHCDQMMGINRDVERELERRMGEMGIAGKYQSQIKRDTGEKKGA